MKTSETVRLPDAFRLSAKDDLALGAVEVFGEWSDAGRTIIVTVGSSRQYSVQMTLIAVSFKSWTAAFIDGEWIQKL